MKIKLLLVFFIIYSMSSCSNNNSTSKYSPFLFSVDTISLHLKYAENIYSIPAPAEISFLIRNCGLKYFQNMVLEPDIIAKAEKNTIHQSLLLGALGADLNYLNIYCQKDQENELFTYVKKLMSDLDINPSEGNFSNNIAKSNFDNSDSTFCSLMTLFRNNDHYLKENDRLDISTLILTGSWIESFYILTKLYFSTNNSEVYNLITYQEKILDNLIKILSPYYGKSMEYSQLVDRLVNIAYEFDVQDFTCSIRDVTTDSSVRITTVHNNLHINSDGSGLNHLYQLAIDLEKK